MKNQENPAGSAAPPAALNEIPNDFYAKIAKAFKFRAAELKMKPRSKKYDLAEVEFVVGAIAGAEALGYGLAADSFVPMLIMTNRFVEIYAKEAV